MSSIRIGLPVFMMDVSKGKYISRKVIQDETVNSTSSVKWTILGQNLKIKKKNQSRTNFKVSSKK